MKQEVLCSKNKLSDTPFLNASAKSYLTYLGNNNPSCQQVAAIQSLLSETSQNQSFSIGLLLNQQEKQCLYLSAQGKKLKEIAILLNLSQNEISQCRQSILQKLGCKTMSRAVIVGIRYGEIKAADIDIMI